MDLLLSDNNENDPLALLGDFNAYCSKWCNSGKSNEAGMEVDNITTSVGQLINAPTQFVNKNSSCIDLIFSSDLN